MLKDDRHFAFHPKCKRTNIVGLLFTDDTLVFCKANLDSIKLVKKSWRISLKCLVYLVTLKNQKCLL